MTSALFPTYARADLAFERGEGAWLFAANGDRYLDFGAGVAVNSLGHAHPRLVETLRAAAEKPWHVSNLFQIPQAERLARRLVDATFADRVFFSNSGAEAVECAIKTARKYHAANGAPERYRLITFEGAFHGRTLATLAAGGNQKYIDGFGPKVDGFDQAPFGDLDAVEALIGPDTAGVLLEPIQGEGAVRRRMGLHYSRREVVPYMDRVIVDPVEVVVVDFKPGGIKHTRIRSCGHENS